MRNQSPAMKVCRELLALVLCCVLFITTLGQSTGRKPNVILVMTDDQGYGELSCHGNPLLVTPHLDRLYQQSVRLTDYHANPMCTPTRSELLTGVEAVKNGAVNVSSGRTFLRADIPTMADHFKYNGYRTGIFGKWHLGDNYPYTPDMRGFEETLWFPSSHIGSVPDYWGNDYFDDTYIHNGKTGKFSGYCTDVFFASAMDWIGGKSKSENPFFLYLPLNAPHSPWVAPEKYIQEMTGVVNDYPLPDMNDQQKNRLIRYLAMIRNVDDNMGRLMQFLDSAQLSDNTILIFTSDNGTTFGHLYFNAGMRGKKTELWEGGHRVPFFIRWPGGGLKSSSDVNGLAHARDVLPTLIELCRLEKAPVSKSPAASASALPKRGVRPDAGLKFDGISLAKVLTGKEQVPDGRLLIINYSRMPAGFDYPSPASPSIVKKTGAVVLWKRWRLLGDDELYNLATDPMQDVNVFEQFPEIAARLRKHLDSWWNDVAAKVNTPIPVVIGDDAANPMLLSSCEWMDVLVDQQAQVRAGAKRNSYWNLDVQKEGEYEFELRRWPRESDLALAEASPDGVALPIGSARLYIEDIMYRQKLQGGEKSAVFTLPLKSGRQTLHTWFDDEHGRPLCGAYYVYIKRK